METNIAKPKMVPSTRFGLAFVMFFGCLFSYAMRTNMSMAIVCMVAPDNSTDSNKTSKCVSASSLDKDEDEKPAMIGEFHWSKDMQGVILGSFFYGYIFSQILGGYLASNFGGKRVILATILGSSILTLVNPVAAYTHVYVLVALRALIGFLQGATFPAMHTMWSVWGPPSEISVLTAITYAGAQIGNVVVLPLAGFLCENLGWASIFYVIGVGGILWCAVWAYFVSDSPSTHKRISTKEREYIVKSCEASMGAHSGKPRATPWVSILTSLPIWACWFGHFAGDWAAYTMALSLPSFLKDVLGLELSSLGALASIPYVAYFVAINLAGFSADKIRSKNILSTVNTRRAAMIIALIGQAIFLILASFCKCGQDMLVIVLITIAMFLSGFQYAGFVVNYLDVAPPFSGTVMGIGNTISSLAGFLSPYVTAQIVREGAQSEWQIVFFICGGILVIGALIFSIFASGSVQEWAKSEPTALGTEMAPLKSKEEANA